MNLLDQETIFNLRKNSSTNPLSKRFQVALQPASKSTDPVVAVLMSLILTAVDAPDVFADVFVFLDGPPLGSFCFCGPYF